MTIQKFEVPDWIRSVLICDPTDIWGNVVGMGLAELAAVLSPAKRFDRRGSVVFFDTFEDGLAKIGGGQTGNGGASSSPSTEWAKSGGSSLKITTGNGGQEFQFNYRMPLVVASNVGVEASFCPGATPGGIRYTLSYYDGTNRYDGALFLDWTNGKLQYLKDDGNYGDLVTGLSLGIGIPQYYTMKLVVNLLDKTYVRWLCNEKSGDISTYNLQPTTDSTEPFLRVLFGTIGVVSSNNPIYYDDVIVTQNEPA